jgi:Cu-Zn family superoxide dismutase
MLKTLQSLTIATLFGTFLLLAGCTQNQTGTTPEPADTDVTIEPETETTETVETRSATAIIDSTADPSETFGEATFTETSDGLEITVMMDNAPAGTHGFHVHEVGSCEDGGKAAQGHFNPDNVEHGYLPDDGFENAHAGDLGNIEIAEDGTGTLNLTIPGLSLEEGNYAIAGRSVILHAQPDDFGQPTGNAGDRLGCGLINLATN